MMTLLFYSFLEQRKIQLGKRISAGKCISPSIGYNLTAQNVIDVLCTSK